jgi:hypothetical protein
MHRLAAHRQERRLKNETEADEKKIESQRPKKPTAHFQNRVRDRDQKTDRRDNEKVSIHWERSILDSALFLAMLRLTWRALT